MMGMNSLGISFIHVYVYLYGNHLHIIMPKAEVLNEIVQREYALWCLPGLSSRNPQNFALHLSRGSLQAVSRYKDLVAKSNHTPGPAHFQKRNQMLIISLFSILPMPTSPKVQSPCSSVRANNSPSRAPSQGLTFKGY